MDMDTIGAGVTTTATITAVVTGVADEMAAHAAAALFGANAAASLMGTGVVSAGPIDDEDENLANGDADMNEFLTS